MITNFNKRISITLLILPQFFILINAQGFREEKYYINSDKHWLVELPLWVPGFRGQLAYGDFNSSSSGNREEKEFEQLENNASLEFYFAGRIMFQYHKLWILADDYSGKVGSSFTFISDDGSNNKELVYITVQGAIPRVVFGYSVWKKSIENNIQFEFIPYLGLRHVNIHLQSDVFDSLNFIDIQPSWFEPIIGFYLPIIYKRFLIEFQFDWGGSIENNTWLINNSFRYRISRLVDIQLGWTLMKFNHKGNFDNEELDLKLRLFGPTAGVGLRF